MTYRISFGCAVCPPALLLQAAARGCHCRVCKLSALPPFARMSETLLAFFERDLAAACSAFVSCLHTPFFAQIVRAEGLASAALLALRSLGRQHNAQAFDVLITLSIHIQQALFFAGSVVSTCHRSSPDKGLTFLPHACSTNRGTQNTIVMPCAVARISSPSAHCSAAVDAFVCKPRTKGNQCWRSAAYVVARACCTITEGMTVWRCMLHAQTAFECSEKLSQCAGVLAKRSAATWVNQTRQCKKEGSGQWTCCVKQLGE